MNRHHARAAMMLAAATLAVGLNACGGDDASPSAANGTDRAFAEAMIPHHRSAVDVAETAKSKSEHAETKKLAASIVTAQNAEIRKMRAAVTRFEAEGIQATSLGMSDLEMGMARDASMLEDLRPFDREFIDLMIPHHQGAIRMARVELERGKDQEMRDLAKAVIDAETREIDEMNLWRVSWYGKASPAGGVPAEKDPQMHDGHDM
jgi:uncharacterized protein (DUF305 family)